MYKQIHKGFTLAEVLVTIAIIGIVAALTIPGLITSTQDNQFKSAWKKTFSAISQASLKKAEDNGGSLKNLYCVGCFPELARGFKPYFNTIGGCTDWGCSSEDVCWHHNGEWTYFDGTSAATAVGKGLILSDGTFLTLYTLSYGCNYNYDGTPNTGICFLANVDVNGKKPPNTVGKDIYRAYIMQNGLVVPDGSPKTPGHFEQDTCNNASTGWGCSFEYLMQ